MRAPPASWPAVRPGGRSKCEGFAGAVYSVVYDDRTGKLQWWAQAYRACTQFMAQLFGANANDSGFALLSRWLGNGCRDVGDRAFYSAMARVLRYEASVGTVVWSALSLTLVLLPLSGPMLAIMPVLGVLADQFERASKGQRPDVAAVAAAGAKAAADSGALPEDSYRDARKVESIASSPQVRAIAKQAAGKASSPSRSGCPVPGGQREPVAPVAVIGDTLKVARIRVASPPAPVMKRQPPAPNPAWAKVAGAVAVAGVVAVVVGRS